MRTLVTLAPEREPYATGVRGLVEVARAAGWEFICLGDEALRGDVPWHAKRFAVREAFDRGSDRVCWCDSDVVIRRPAELARLLNQEGPIGLWSPGPLKLREHLGYIHAQNEDPKDFLRRITEFHADACQDFGVEEGGHFHDWFVLYNVAPAVGLQICDVWDTIARSLREDRITLADGMILSIAAKHLKLPVAFPWRRLTMRRMLTHLLITSANGPLDLRQSSEVPRG